MHAQDVEDSKLANNYGMMTIEACVIIPMSFIITILLLWLSFYYYDRNVITESAAQAAVYGTEYSEWSNDEIKGIVEDKLEECLNNKMVLVKDVNYSVDVSFSEIAVEIDGVIMPPVYFSDGWNIHTIKRTPRLNNSSFVRIVNRIRNKN